MKHRFHRAVLPAIVISVTMAACMKAPPQPLPSDKISAAPDEWLEEPKALPPTAQCDSLPTEKESELCRAKVLLILHNMYTELANRHAALSDYTKALSGKKWTAQVTRAKRDVKPPAARN